MDHDCALAAVYEPVRKEVKGFKIDPLGGHYFYEVSLAGNKHQLRLN
ncbi:hypothetical protein P4S72_08775 [Vibrio sp. PP-XX7]